MITLVECSENDDFNRDADQNGGAKRGGEAEEKRAGRRENGGGDIGADHVREPCARLIRFMMPKIRVNPAAIRNSMTPNWTPFSTCSTA